MPFDKHLPTACQRRLRACKARRAPRFSPFRLGSSRRCAPLSIALCAARPAASGWARMLRAARHVCARTVAAVCRPRFSPNACSQGLTPYAMCTHLPARRMVACSHGRLRWQPRGHRMRVCLVAWAPLGLGEGCVCHSPHRLRRLPWWAMAHEVCRRSTLVGVSKRRFLRLEAAGCALWRRQHLCAGNRLAAAQRVGGSRRDPWAQRRTHTVGVSAARHLGSSAGDEAD